MYKVILLHYPPPFEKNTLKKPSFIRVKLCQEQYQKCQNSKWKSLALHMLNPLDTIHPFVSGILLHISVWRKPISKLFSCRFVVPHNKKVVNGYCRTYCQVWTGCRGVTSTLWMSISNHFRSFSVLFPLKTENLR